MNANELADYWMNRKFAIEMADETADMLRQQQAEIEALKKDNKELHAIAQGMAMAESDARKSLQWFKDAKERQSEPVAWMDYLEHSDVYDLNVSGRGIPLYTHPAKYCPSENNAAYKKGFIEGMAKMTESAVHRAVEGMSAKTLTDEEIEDLADKYLSVNYKYGEDIYVLGEVEFARAILRKAQEK